MLRRDGARPPARFVPRLTKCLNTWVYPKQGRSAIEANVEESDADKRTAGLGAGHRARLSSAEPRYAATLPCAGTTLRSSRRRILPMLVFGSGSVRNSMIFGTL